MLHKVNKVLLLSDVASFSDNYKALAEESDVRLRVESEWSKMYRVTEEVVILGSKYLDKLNKAYYPNAVIILKEGESPSLYISEGISHFIFNYKNVFELVCAFYKNDKTLVNSLSKDLETVLEDCPSTRYIFGDYDFDFAKNRFKYKGKLIFFSESCKKYLAQWLLNGNKDNAKRMIICNLRKKFGSEFLADVNRFGELIGGKE